MAEALEHARSHHLTVIDDRIHEPPPGLPAAYLSAPGTHLVVPPSPYEQCRVMVEAARELERQAHERLQDLAARVQLDPPLLRWLGKLNLVPTSDTPAGIGLWAGNAGAFAVGTVDDWATKVKYGELSPFVDGLFLRPQSLTWQQQIRYGVQPSNWRPKAGHAAAHARWTRVGHVANAGGAALAGGTAAWNQWQADQDDPSIEATEQVARAGTVAVAARSGPWSAGPSAARSGAWPARPPGNGPGTRSRASSATPRTGRSNWPRTSAASSRRGEQTYEFLTVGPTFVPAALAHVLRLAPRPVLGAAPIPTSAASIEALFDAVADTRTAAWTELVDALGAESLREPGWRASRILCTWPGPDREPAGRSALLLEHPSGLLRGQAAADGATDWTPTRTGAIWRELIGLLPADEELPAPDGG